MYPDNWDDYMWLVIVGALLSFYMAYGIGANDVANSFGTSVGAKTITLKQACLIAAVFEFAGAVGLGGEVTRTISGNIARPTAFYREPELFAWGMVCALASAGTIVMIATYFSLAVSTTHSIIGAVLGFAFVWGGSDAVVWNDRMDAFPYSRGLVPVICSWFVSPLSAGIVASFLFFMNRAFILRREASTKWAIYSFPVLVTITVFINVFFVLYRGARAVLGWDSNKAAWVAGIVAGCTFVLGLFPGIWILRRSVKRDMERQAEKEAEAANPAAKITIEGEGDADKAEPSSKMAKVWQSFKKAATKGLDVDIHTQIEQSEKVHEIHAAAEIFDPETEQVYKYLQVFSACAVAFAHGANDVANAVGPFSGIWFVYRRWAVASRADSPYWILALGGAGLVVGLGTYGYNIMATLGVGIAKFTPSRGYCAELATSFTVSVASVYGLPISTTQCITGAEVGVGMTENIRTGVNYKLFGRQVLAWIAALVCSALLSAAFFSIGAYSPSLTMAKDIAIYEDTMRAVSESLYRELNVSNFALRSNFSDKPFDVKLNATITSKMSAFRSMFRFSTIGEVDASALARELNASIATYRNYSVVITGFNRSTRAFTQPGGALADTMITVAPIRNTTLATK